MEKPDFLKDCINDPALVSGQTPIDQFCRRYCTICANRACSRAGCNGMAFDKRAANWEKDLFLNVPRIRENDPNFAHIWSKNFAPKTPGISVSLNTGFTPVEKNEPIRFVQAESSTATNVPTPVETPTPSLVSAEEVKPKPTRTVTENTPFAQGVILPGGKPASDSTAQERVVTPGASFTFDD